MSKLVKFRETETMIARGRGKGGAGNYCSMCSVSVLEDEKVLWKMDGGDGGTPVLKSYMSMNFKTT